MNQILPSRRGAPFVRARSEKCGTGKWLDDGILASRWLESAHAESGVLDSADSYRSPTNLTTKYARVEK